MPVWRTLAMVATTQPPFIALLVVSLLLMTSMPAAAADGLAGYWPMDEGEGTIVDECSGAGMGSEGRVQGEVVWQTTDRGHSIRFDGRTTAVCIPSSPDWNSGDGALTVSLWLRLGRPAGGIILDHGFGGAAGAWGLVVEGGPTFALYNAAVKPVKLRFEGFRFGAWEHIAVVWRRGKAGWLKGYLNGKLVRQIENVDCPVRQTESLFVGGRQGTDQFVAGNLRDLALLNKVLTDQEVAAVCQRGVPLGAALVVSSLRSEKILYRPGETGAAAVRVKNVSQDAQSAELVVNIASGLGQQREVLRQRMEIGPRATRALRVPLPLAGEEYGCEVVAAIQQSGKTVAEKRDYFSVAENFFHVGIGSDWGSGLHTANLQCLDVPQRARKLYSNWYELFFWSPCDWALHVAPQKRWWSGQASYAEDEDNLVELMRKSHEQGIRVAFYANANPAGPYAWEAARRHPQWFGGGGFGRTSAYRVEALDHWNDPEWRNGVKSNPGWFVVPVDLRRPDALDYGIDRILDSVRKYGWDAVRFDGHYTILGNDEMSTRNMRRLKERVWKESPGFRFGFNYGRAPEFHGGTTHEMREAMAGGGLYLQEGIRNWRYTGDQYTRWQHYATNELRIAKLVQRLGGSYHCMWDDVRLKPAQAYYKLIYGLIAGGHPAGSGIYSKSTGCASWGAFMTRWSVLLWHQGLAAAPEEIQRFAVGNPQVQWKELVQQCVLSPTRKLVVLHLVNAPTSDEIASTDFPPPIAETTVAYRLPPGATLVSVTAVRPDVLPFSTPLAPREASAGLEVHVPAVQHWTIVAWELAGDFQVPSVPPPFTEPPDPAKLAWSPTEGLVTRLDPNQDDVSAGSGDPNETVIPLTTGGVNIGRVTTIDPDSPQRSVQWRNKEKPTGKIGRWWTGPYAPGRYQLSIRLKWTDAAPQATPQALSMRIMAEKGGSLIDRPVNLVTPDHPRAPPGAMHLGPKGVYQTYEIGAVDIKQPEYFTFDGVASTTAVGENTLYAEKILVRLVERYTDSQLAQSTKVEKPSGLRTPCGERPQKAILVRGLFSRYYDLESCLACQTTYDLPAKYEDLYAADVVILCNMDLRKSAFAARKMLKDFIEDGGRLVILGGNRTLGEGGMKGTYLEDLSPFTLRQRDEVVACDPPLLLKLQGRDAGSPPVESSSGPPASPALLWRHDVALKPGADVLAHAGEHPIAARARCGKGQALVFAGTVLGEARPDARPFWECPEWKTLARKLLLE